VDNAAIAVNTRRMDPVLTLAGLGVGIVVGLTGMGGGALMTPVLVLFFGVPPLAAVSSDLVASAVMKPFGSFVHIRRGTVNWSLVGWLCAGSVPSAFLGVLLMRAIGTGGGVQHAVQLALGVALLLAVAGLIVKAYRETSRRAGGGPSGAPLRVRPVPTLLLGALGGLVVGLTSVGSGSLIIVVLLALYPTLRANDLVGTDLVQAVPLVAAAALGHVFFGDLHLDLSAAILVGSIPGVLLGARLSSRAPAGAIRAALVLVLLASALKLFGASNLVVVVALVVVALAGTIASATRRAALSRPGITGSSPTYVDSNGP
jgi:uncharacterized membrane protein YfcA